MYIDTHCHIHDPEFFDSNSAQIACQQAVESGIERIILVGTNIDDSKNALVFAENNAPYCHASIGIHPHEATKLSKTRLLRN